MSQPTTYEQLIAQKLQELPVPDQADAIWATIEHQLNIEMPNGPSSGSGGLNNSNWWMGGTLFILLTAIIIYFFIAKENPRINKSLKDKPAVFKQEQPLENKPDTAILIVTPADAKIPEGKSSPEIDAPEIQEVGKNPVNEVEGIPPLQNIPNGPELRTRPADTVVTRKRPRGVKGITDADYRLTPSSKDSIRPKNE